MKNTYIKPKIKVFKIQPLHIMAGSYNKVGPYGFGDKDDEDRQGDDNWDKDWSGWND